MERRFWTTSKWGMERWIGSTSTGRRYRELAEKEQVEGLTEENYNDR
jgi:hypothetical protein